MANKVRMELEGAAELEAALRELPFRVAKSTLRRALKRAAVVMVERGASMAPTPELKVRMTNSDRLSRRQRAQTGRQTRATSGTYVVTTFVGERPHALAHLFEFGSSPRYTTGGGDARGKKGRTARDKGMGGAYRGIMPMQPFMRPAFDQTAPQVINDFGRILGREIEASARRLAKRKAKRASAGAVSANRSV